MHGNAASGSAEIVTRITTLEAHVAPLRISVDIPSGQGSWHPLSAAIGPFPHCHKPHRDTIFAIGVT